MSVFGLYSRYYDLLYRDKDYAGESKYVTELIRRFKPQATDLLELGSGTGGHAEFLAREGFSVTGIDLSDSMLARAQQRRESLPVDVAERIGFEKGDVRAWRASGGRQFDVVVSLFHVFSYQTGNRDLGAAFETAAVHLKPGGLLIFDYWFGPSVLRQWPEVRVKRLEDEHIAMTRIAEPRMYPAEDRVRVDYTVMIEPKDGGTPERITESHDMRYLFLPELEWLASSAFSTKCHIGWMKSQSPGFDDWSAVSVMEKTPS